jgi:hypothetical protein
MGTRIPGLITLAALTALAWSTGCDDDPSLFPYSVGGACRSDSQCAGECQTGGDFPDGLCTFPCEDDGQCPAGWYCIRKRDGICMRGCSSDRQCAADLGPSWECKDHSREGARGKIDICIGD